jgi:rhodanese-related sulfurtransferase
VKHALLHIADQKETAMSQIETISPEHAVDLVQQGAVLIDIRETAEHASENIPGARHHALSQIDAAHPAREGDTVLIYHCKSGARTKMNAHKLAAGAGDCQVYILSGGIEAWKRAGLPTSASQADTDAAPQGGLMQRLAALFR